MELVKNQIKVQLASTESANRVIESMQGKIIQDQKVGAYHDLTVLSSPNAGAL